MNLKGTIATDGAIPRELFKLPVLKSCCPAEEEVDLAVKLGCYLGAGVEPQPERDDAVTAEDIVDKLLFVVRILKERDDVHALKNS